MKLCVLMSMYNGKEFVLDQIRSIITQETDCEIQIVVRDDGSKDGSAELVEEFAKDNESDIQVVKGENLGPTRSFMWLINHCPDAYYYAFSDQDDIWLPGKVERAVSRLRTDIPAMWISNYNVVDSGLSLITKCPIDKPADDPAKILFYNNVPGCVMIFNRELLTVMQRLELPDFRMHDILALDIAALYGNICFEPQAYLLYRQHGNNVIGYAHKTIRPMKWIKDKCRMITHRQDYRIAEYAGKMLQICPQLFSEKKRKQFEIIADYKKSLPRMIRLLRQEFTHNGLNRTSLSIRWKIRLKYF